MAVAVLLLLAAWGLARRRTVARLAVLALTIVLAAEVLRLVVTWLPLPEYLPGQLVVLLAGGELLLALAALTLRELGSESMRAFYGRV
jgi:hypothetical protein